MNEENPKDPKTLPEAIDALREMLGQLETSSKKLHQTLALIVAGVVAKFPGDLDKALVEMRASRPLMTREDLILLAKLGQKIKAGQLLTEAEDQSLRDASEKYFNWVRNQRNQ
jgi:ATP/maltotriose-dependent transcriptional regulator MalT